ncbi:MAG: hypothetical protein ACUVV0_08405 [Anaerolineae bacterium]
MQRQETLDLLASIIESLVMKGIYASPEEAVKALALKHIDRDIAKYRRKISALEKKYGMSFEEFTEHIRGRATMQEEIDWEEWSDARLMLEVRQKNRRELKAHVAVCN